MLNDLGGYKDCLSENIHNKIMDLTLNKHRHHCYYKINVLIGADDGLSTYFTGHRLVV